ncbi:MAG: hypothetical protein EBU84_21145 [Actinobacteria bacterium]|nr:hypothetical protein [Actinomycetota bacterium]
MIHAFEWNETIDHADIWRQFEVDGVVALNSFLTQGEVRKYRESVVIALADIRSDIGESKLESAGEVGVARAPMKYRPELLDLLGLSRLRGPAVELLGAGSICHLMNGLVLPPQTRSIGEVFQGKFHRDFPRYLNGYLASVNTFVCLDDFTIKNGATKFLVGSHQMEDPPSEDFIQNATQVEASSGTVLVFDSTIWHAAGENRSTNPRVGLNVQWTRAFIKQQLDLVRYLGLAKCEALQGDVQASLGMHSRVATSLEEYYLPSDQRLYRSGQG